jgi:CBS domain-containing protein
MLEYNDSLTIGDIIRFIATEHERTCILKNDDGRLYGVLSQGDLIKAIWNGAELITPISNIINPKLKKGGHCSSTLWTKYIKVELVEYLIN